MSRIPVTMTREGKYLFKIDLDDVPSGFEDCLEDSTFHRLLNKGMALAELGHPQLDDHVDPRVKLLRLKQIYQERVAANIRITTATPDYLIGEVIPQGIHAGIVKELDLNKALWIAPRIVFDVDGNLVDIVTYDLVP